MKTITLASFTNKGGIGKYSQGLSNALECDKLNWPYQTRISRLLGPITFLPKLIKTLKTYDVVHIQYHIGEYLFLFLPILKIAKLFGKAKIVITLHECDERFPPFVKWYHQLFLKADAFIVHSQWHNNKILTGTVITIPLGSSKKPIKQKITKKLIVTPGFVQPWKGCETAIKTIATLPKEYKLIFLGKTINKPYYKKLKTLINTLELNNRISFTETFTSDKHYDMICSAAEIILLPYQTTSGSLALVDAIRLGKPVVCSNLPVFKEYIGEKNVAKTLEEYRQLILKGGTKVNPKKFDWKKIAITTKKLYTNL